MKKYKIVKRWCKGYGFYEYSLWKRFVLVWIPVAYKCGDTGLKRIEEYIKDDKKTQKKEVWFVK